MSSYWEARLGGLIAAGGVIWAVHLGTLQYSGLANLHLKADPLLVCCLGIAIWLHAKWRGSITLK